MTVKIMTLNPDMVDHSVSHFRARISDTTGVLSIN